MRTGFVQEHPWVLVEGRGAAADDAIVRLRRLGYEVARCDGPTERSPCPLLTRGTCPLVDAAEVVVNALGPADAKGEIARATARSAGVLRIGEDGSGFGVATEPMPPERLVPALRVAFELAPQVD